MSTSESGIKSIVGWIGALILGASGVFLSDSLNDPSCQWAEDVITDDKLNSNLSETDGKEIVNLAAKKLSDCLRENIR